MPHRSGLIGQQTKVVFVVLDFFLDVLEFTGDATTAITRHPRAERIGIAESILSVAAAVLQVLIRSWSRRKKKIEIKFKNLFEECFD